MPHDAKLRSNVPKLRQAAIAEIIREQGGERNRTVMVSGLPCGNYRQHLEGLTTLRLFEELREVRRQSKIPSYVHYAQHPGSLSVVSASGAWVHA